MWRGKFHTIPRKNQDNVSFVTSELHLQVTKHYRMFTEISDAI